MTRLIVITVLQTAARPTAPWPTPHQGGGAGVRGERAAAGGEQEVSRDEVPRLAQSGLQHVDGV